jgi:hypothetical protein
MTAATTRIVRDGGFVLDMGAGLYAPHGAPRNDSERSRFLVLLRATPVFTTVGSKSSVDPEIERIRLTLGAALAPSPEHGPRALLYGGTAALRRACLDALQAALERAPTPRPMVVRVPGPTPELRLPDAIADAVESALEARRAPGGLYEDRGDEVVRSLGGWLFRARSVGFSGIALFIDDLDGHLDARGRPGVASEEWFRTLLGAIARRAVSLVATARAADAAGGPSLPQETVAQFSLRESLGGPSTVLARDPSTLVAALAGRTFSRSSLHRALDAWLDVPLDPADDAVLVFSSPLSPPALPSIPPSVFSEPAPRHSDIRPSRAQEGVALGDLSEWSAALAASVELAAAIRAARSHPLAEKESLENSFRTGVSRMPRRIERVAAGASRLGVDAPRMLARAAEMLAHYESAVAPLIHGHAIDEPSLAELTDLCAAHASALGARVSATVVLTGLRADLGETFVPGVITSLPGARVVAQGLRWTVPASPERTRALAEVIDRTPWDDALHPQRERLEGREVYRVSAYAKGLRGSGRRLDEVASRVEASLAATLRSWLSGWSGPVALLFVSDVGVGAEDARGERALGDGSAFAQILPWWIVTVGAAV